MENGRERNNAFAIRNTDNVFLVDVNKILCQCFIYEDPAQQTYVLMKRSTVLEI